MARQSKAPGRIPLPSAIRVKMRRKSRSLGRSRAAATTPGDWSRPVTRVSSWAREPPTAQTTLLPAAAASLIRSAISCCTRGRSASTCRSSRAMNSAPFQPRCSAPSWPLRKAVTRRSTISRPTRWDTTVDERSCWACRRIARRRCVLPTAVGPCRRSTRGDPTLRPDIARATAKALPVPAVGTKRSKLTSGPSGERSSSADGESMAFEDLIEEGPIPRVLYRSTALDVLFRRGRRAGSG